MRIILAGHPGSQCIVKASQYLTAKYLPGFLIEYLNYEGPIDGWSEYLSDYIFPIKDELIIFALDDYLIAKEINKEEYEKAVKLFDDPDVCCVKLFPCSEEEHEDYPVTTQYTIWRKKILVFVLDQTKSPWDFEVGGSEIFKRCKLKSIRLENPPLEYDTHSCLSKRWSGVRLNGLSAEDIASINELI